MYLLRFLTVFAVIQFIYAGTGQGIEPNNEKPSSKEVEESVKQEVFLKTANAEPIEIDRVKRFETNNNAPVQSLRRTVELDEMTVSPAPRLGYGTDTNVGIGQGTSGRTGYQPQQNSGIGSGTGYTGYQPKQNVGIGHGTSGTSGIGSGTTVYNGYQPNQNAGIGSGTTGIGSGTGYQPNVNAGIGQGVSGTPGIGSGTGYQPRQNSGIGSGTAYGSYTPDVGHGVKVGGKVPAIGSGTAEDIDEVGIGQGTSTGDSKGGRVHLNGDPDSVNTELGGEVKIGRGVSRARRNSQFDRFDTGFAKECNSYYGKVICYRVYTNPSIATPSEYTCWKISNHRKNCTEIDNIVYLKNRGFQPEEYEIPRTNSQQHPRPRNRQEPEEYETTSTWNRQHPRPREDILQGQSQDYSQNVPTPRRGSPGETHRFVTSTLKLGRDSSLEADDNRELYRQKRKRAVKTKKPYYIPTDYETMDEYEEMRAKNKGKTLQQQPQKTSPSLPSQ